MRARCERRGTQPKHGLVGACLRDGLPKGRWSGRLPGVLRLAAELGVPPHTVRRALRQLEAEPYGE